MGLLHRWRISRAVAAATSAVPGLFKIDPLLFPDTTSYMKIFTALYDKTVKWAAHRHAQHYLFVVSFCESFVFPIPVDVMIAPMAIARPNMAMRIALIATVASVLGGLFGYFIGIALYEVIEPWLGQHQKVYEEAQTLLMEHSFWIIFVAGFSPIPYKVFTIAAGVVALSLPVFFVASVLSRGLRFFLVSLIMARLGPIVEDRLRHWMEWIGWLLVLVVVALVLWF